MPGVVAKAGALYERRMQRVQYRRTLRVLPTAVLWQGHQPRPSEPAPAGGLPDFDTDVTSAPFSTRYLHTREPTKPEPPTTATFGAAAAAMAESEIRSIPF